MGAPAVCRVLLCRTFYAVVHFDFNPTRCSFFVRSLQARFVPTLVLERLRAAGEAAAVPKKSLSGGVETTAMAVGADEGVNSPKVDVVGSSRAQPPLQLCSKNISCSLVVAAVERPHLPLSLSPVEASPLACQAGPQLVPSVQRLCIWDQICFSGLVSGNTERVQPPVVCLPELSAGVLLHKLAPDERRRQYLMLVAEPSRPEESVFYQ